MRHINSFLPSFHSTTTYIISKSINMMIVHTTNFCYPPNSMCKQIQQRHSIHANQSILISSPRHLRYMSTKIDRKIRNPSHSSIAKYFLARKHNWTMQLMERINWEDHSTSIRKLYHSKKRFTRRFIHHPLQQAICSSSIDHNVPIATLYSQTEHIIITS